MRKRVMFFALLFSAVFCLLFTRPLSAAETATENKKAPEEASSAEWHRVLRNNTEYIQVGDNYFYYTADEKYTVYQEPVNGGKTRKIVSFKNSVATPEIYTNGEKIVYVYTRNGSIVKCADVKTKKSHVVLTLEPFRTQKSCDWILSLNLYGNYLYYTKYRGLQTLLRGIYRVNIDTGKSELLDKTNIVGSLKSQQLGGQYFPVIDKKENVYIYDISSKKKTKLGGREVFCLIREGDAWYYVKCKNPNAAKKTYTVWKKALNGKGKSKKVAQFSCKQKAEDIIEFTSTYITFFGNAEYATEYSFLKKKLKINKNKDMWYFINRAMSYT